MSATARRVRVERNIYRRPDGKLEVGFRDSTSRQRWKSVEGGITRARAVRDDLLGRKGRGEHVQPSPRLRFAQASERWLAEQVSELRPSTRERYTSDVRLHLEPAWGRRRLDAISVDDCAQLVRMLRAAGLSEWSIAGVLVAAGRIFRFASRRMGWQGTNPVSGLDRSERPKVASTQRRRIFGGDELRQTLDAAGQPWRTLFALAAVTGARLSELLGLTWQDVDLTDAEQTTVEIAWQVDRRGVRQPLKTEESRRTIELPRSLVALLLEHRARSARSAAGDFVFCTRSGRALGQRNVTRALRAAQERARAEGGGPTYPTLFAHDERGHLIVDSRGAFKLRPRREVPRGAVPNFHAFRHSAVSEAIAAGESAEEVSWQLGHKSSQVTRTVYVQEIKSAERRARRRAKMEARYGPLLGSALEAAERSSEQQTPTPLAAELVDLQQARDMAQ